MKRILYLLLFVIQSIIVNGQRGYYEKDSTVFVNIKLVDNNALINARKCQIIEKGKTVTYSPDEVKAYGFYNGKEYKSKMIKIKNEEKRVFLEKLNEGDLVLYYFKDKQGKRFFLEQKGDSGQIVEIPRKGVEKHHFRGILKPYVQDCNNISEALKLVTYHKPSLTKFANHYNSCSSKPFPFIRYGLTLGYGFVQPSGFKISKPVIKDAVFKNDYTLNVGIFADLPIFNSYFSFHPEMYIQKNAFTSHSVIVNNVNDIVINATSLNVPLLIRYTFPTSKLRPYINAGSTLSYNVRNDNEAYTVTTNNNIVEIESISSDTFYSEKQMGATVGAGIQYNIDYKRSLFFELRNTRLYGFTKETYGNKSLQCLIGINF